MSKLYIIIVVFLWVAPHAIDAEKAEALKKDEPVWGSTFQGMAISVRQTKERYAVGDKIEIVVLMKNFGDTEASVLRVGDVAGNYRLALFDANGLPVAKREGAEAREAAFGEPKIASRRLIKIGPGEMGPAYEELILNDWFKIEKKGTYFLIAMRRLWSWDKGFVISNMVKIKIAESAVEKAGESSEGKNSDLSPGQE